MTKGLNALTQGTFVIQTQTSVIYIFVETKTRKRKAVIQTPTSVIYIFVETKTRKRKAIKLRATEKERKFFLFPQQQRSLFLSLAALTPEATRL
jgi:hypothetical protein